MNDKIKSVQEEADDKRVEQMNKDTNSAVQAVFELTPQSLKKTLAGLQTRLSQGEYTLAREFGAGVPQELLTMCNISTIKAFLHMLSGEDEETFFNRWNAVLLTLMVPHIEEGVESLRRARLTEGTPAAAGLYLPGQ